jgi:hypothetical protein
MKYKYILLVVICLAVASSIATIGYMQTNEQETIEVKVQASKDTYSLGEVVSINIETKNIGQSEATIRSNLPPAELYISADGKSYRECTNTVRKKYDELPQPLRLSLNESVVNSETILWNSDSDSNDSVRPWKVGRVLNDYVFPKAGNYYIKAKYVIYLSAKHMVIESKPIKITITEPEGESLDVWNKIKDRGDFAYFIQYGEFLAPLYKPEERAKFQQEVEQILADYPNSFYSEFLRQSLDKFRANEAKRQESWQKLQNQKEKPQ